MTKEQRQILAGRVEKLLRMWWGDEFDETHDAIQIYDYCMDETESESPRVVAMEYELKYG